jgi:hypothetical protein
MNRMEAILLGAAVCLATGAEAADAGRREKPAVLPAVVATTLVAVPLDADVHAAAALDYGDLRILDATGVEVPHMLRDVTRSDRRPVRRTTRATRPEAKPLADNGLEIFVVLGPGQERIVPEGFTILTPLHDFEHRVAVSWSADGRAWTPLVTEALMYDFARFIDVRDVTIPLPPVPAHGPGGRYRIVISDVTQEQESRLAELTRSASTASSFPTPRRSSSGPPRCSATRRSWASARPASPTAGRRESPSTPAGSPSPSSRLRPTRRTSAGR